MSFQKKVSSANEYLHRNLEKNLLCLPRSVSKWDWPQASCQCSLTALAGVKENKTWLNIEGSQPMPSSKKLLEIYISFKALCSLTGRTIHTDTLREQLSPDATNAQVPVSSAHHSYFLFLKKR